MTRDELVCFLDKERPCDPSCIAYVEVIEQNKGPLSRSQQCCTLLVSAEALTRNVCSSAGVLTPLLRTLAQSAIQRLQAQPRVPT